MTVFNEYMSDSLYFHHILDRQPNPDVFTMHNHAFYEIYCFISGKGSFFIEGSEYPLCSGDILIMNNNEAHYIAIDPTVPYERFALHFRKELIRPIDSEGVLLKAFEDREAGKRNRFTASDFKDSVYSVIIENLMYAGVSDKHLHSVSNLFALLNEIHIAYENADISNAAEKDTTAYKIIGYINSRLRQPLSLDEICENFCISKAQLCRIFKKVTGTTVWNYITVKRLVAAQSMILSGQPATKVYVECGFGDYSAFFRAYKNHFGYSPAETKSYTCIYKPMV